MNPHQLESQKEGEEKNYLQLNSKNKCNLKPVSNHFPLVGEASQLGMQFLA